MAQNLQTITGTINVAVFFFFFFQFNQILCEPAEPLAVIVTVTNYDNSLVSLIISGQICDVWWEYAIKMATGGKEPCTSNTYFHPLVSNQSSTILWQQCMNQKFTCEKSMMLTKHIFRNLLSVSLETPIFVKH